MYAGNAEVARTGKSVCQEGTGKSLWKNVTRNWLYPDCLKSWGKKNTVWSIPKRESNSVWTEASRQKADLQTLKETVDSPGFCAGERIMYLQNMSFMPWHIILAGCIAESRKTSLICTFMSWKKTQRKLHNFVTKIWYKNIGTARLSLFALYKKNEWRSTLAWFIRHFSTHEERAVH